jgi:ribosomal protein S18 acetylase RimI-like enzyme
MIRLEPMSEEEFEASLAQNVARRAEESTALGIWTQEEAEAASRADFDQLLPHGRRTPGFQFRTILEEESGLRVGETWFSAQAIGGKVQFWVNWIWVEPPFRRRGIATSTFRLLEEEAVRAGAERVGLYVHAENEGARALYRRLGFSPTGIRMAKKLDRPG